MTNQNANSLQQPLPCIVCGTQLKFVFESNGREEEVMSYSPNKGLEFRGQGNYGSRYDALPLPEDKASFLINICDDCFEKALDNGNVGIRRHTTVRTQTTEAASKDNIYHY